jgi:hypothetical protein
MAFGYDMGPSSQENNQYSSLTGLTSTEAGQGLGDLNESQGFMDAILSGDPTKIGQVLSPQIKAIQGQGQQQKQTNATFGNRSGGTNATNQNIDDKTKGSIDDLISSLTGSALQTTNSNGLALTSNAQTGFGTGFGEAKTMQGQRAAQFTDLLSSIGDVASGAIAGAGL